MVRTIDYYRYPIRSFDLNLILILIRFFRWEFIVVRKVKCRPRQGGGEGGGKGGGGHRSDRLPGIDGRTGHVGHFDGRAASFICKYQFKSFS